MKVDGRCHLMRFAGLAHYDLIWFPLQSAACFRPEGHRREVKINGMEGEQQKTKEGFQSIDLRL